MTDLRLNRLRLWLANKLDPHRAKRVWEAEHKAHVLRDALKQVAWRQVMDLRSHDQRLAYYIIQKTLEQHP